jgi:hypothetical protein
MSGSLEDNNPYVQQSGEECVRSPASTTASTSLQANINKRYDREGELSKLVLQDRNKERKFTTPSPLDLGFASPHMMPVIKEEGLTNYTQHYPPKD